MTSLLPHGKCVWSQLICHAEVSAGEQVCESWFHVDRFFRKPAGTSLPIPPRSQLGTEVIPFLRGGDAWPAYGSLWLGGVRQRRWHGDFL